MLRGAHLSVSPPDSTATGTSRRTERGTHRAQRQQLAALHAELVRHGLVAWTEGNLSERVPGQQQFLIKGRGLPCDGLTWEAITVCDLDGVVVDGLHEPSPDAAAHAHVYRHMADVGGQAHTHSAYATAWSVRAEAIPCVTTTMAATFGGPIPVGPVATSGETVGRGLVTAVGASRSPAVLMANDGVFALGGSARDALRIAVMCEDAARTVHLARQLGTPLPLTQAEIDAAYCHPRIRHQPPPAADPKQSPTRSATVHHAEDVR